MRTTVFLLGAIIAGTVFGSGIAMWSFFYFPSQASVEEGLVPADSDSPKANPSLEVDEKEFDFGSMDGHAVGTHEFVFRNVGQGQLELKKGRTTCKCTLSDIGDGVIPPGGSGKVSLEWKGKGGVGPYEQTATIITNDPENPTVDLHIRGEMTAKARVVPETLVFSSVASGQPAHASVRVFGYLDEPLEITGHKTDDPEHLEVSFSPIPKDEVEGEKYATCGQRVDVTLKPGLPPGPFHKTIRVMTNLKGLEELLIPVEGLVASEISVFGSGWSSENGVLRFGNVGRGKTERRLMLKVGGSHPDEVKFEISEIRPEFVHVTLGERSSPPGSHVAVTPLEIEIPEGSPPCNYLGPKREKLGLIRLKTTHATVKELDIYLQFLISG